MSKAGPMPRSDRAPSFLFFPADWLADAVVDGMSFDEQGRYLRALCMTWQTPTPGIAPEEQWRSWMKFTEPEWRDHRERMSMAFQVRPDGTWVQKRTVRVRREQRARRTAAKEAGRLSGVARRLKLANES